jgi:cell wall-associated NlpC family hydrolase
MMNFEGAKLGRCGSKARWRGAGAWLRVALVAVVAAFVTACGAKGPVATPTPRPFPGAPAPPTAVPAPVTAGPTAAPSPTAPTGDDAAAEGAAAHPLVTLALTFLGTPYRYGGSDPSGFDCSGFVQWVFSRIGTALPREVRDQFRVGTAIDDDQIRAGDLVFFQTVANGASHVGIALGDGRFVHAPSSRGVVRIEPYTAGYWAERWVGARRVLGL